MSNTSPAGSHRVELTQPHSPAHHLSSCDPDVYLCDYTKWQVTMLSKIATISEFLLTVIKSGLLSTGCPKPPWLDTQQERPSDILQEPSTPAYLLKPRRAPANRAPQARDLDSGLAKANCSFHIPANQDHRPSRYPPTLTPGRRPHAMPF